jgi:CRP-like cAMP-binding protein
LDAILVEAFGPGALVGHLAYVLLIASMVMSRMLWLRVLALAAFATGIFYSAAILGDLVSTFWESLLAFVSLAQLVRLWLADRRTRFAPHEAALVARCFPGSPRRVQRALLDLGRWEDLPDGARLTTDGVPVPDLCWLAEGEAEVLRAEVPIARLGAGALIGEMSVASGGPAHGSVRLIGPARLWRIEAGVVRRTLATRPDLAAALQSAFFASLRDKLIAQT